MIDTKILKLASLSVVGFRVNNSIDAMCAKVRGSFSHVQNACNCLALVDLFYPEFVTKISCQT